jgi:hypothetical protein
MRILKQSLALVALGSLLVIAPAAAQAGGTGAFQWYVGGHGGVTSFRTASEGRELWPTAGGHFLITAKRTGLLLSVDQAFGSDDESVTTLYEVRDGSGAVTESGTETWAFDGIRRYSAVLLAYPVRNRNIQPYIGVGGGIVHTTNNRNALGSPVADGSVESGLSSSGFATAVAGLEFRVGPFSAFGQYQVTTKQGFQRVDTAFGDGTRVDAGEWTLGAFHVLTGGLRFSLGGSRESNMGGGY